LALVLLVPSGSHAEDPDIRLAPGIDWENLVVRATGAGPPDVNALGREQARSGAEKAAKADALKSLLDQVKGVPLTAGKTVGQAMASDEIRAKVESVVASYKITSKRYYSDLGLELDVALPLPLLADLFAPPSPAPAEGPDAGTRAVPTKMQKGKENTGLIVDARGLQLTPALMPRFQDESGQQLYGVESLTPDARKASGAASYLRSVEQAKKDPRLGSRPLVLKAVKASGSNLVLGADAKAKLEHLGRYLREGRVIIVIG
jgi:hypothetical protein